MKKILPIKFLYAHCVGCGAYKTCDFTSLDECSALLVKTRKEYDSIEPKPEKTRLERSLDRLDKLLDEQEKSIRRMCEILDRL